MACPIPELPPVTITTFLFKPNQLVIIKPPVLFNYIINVYAYNINRFFLEKLENEHLN
uniref:Uncharacterized protein n=1 Tax=Staphylococcus aureus TaxID=1280 RepID=A0A5A4RIP0_STAAU|nr:hypothetical protein [Staphylococcus aureus]